MLVSGTSRADAINRFSHVSQLLNNAISDIIVWKGRFMMRVLLLLPILMVTVWTSISFAASEVTDAGKAGPNQGLTLENIGRGIKSAAKNIEEEIPKIGPAVGDTFKKLTASDKDKEAPKGSTQNSGKSKK
jgi:hypothetical protein